MFVYPINPGNNVRSSARPRFSRPAIAGGVRPSRSLISTSDSPWQCRSTRAWRLSSGKRARASTRRRIASFRSACSDGEDCSAASHASSRADEASIAASSDRSLAASRFARPMQPRGISQVAGQETTEPGCHLGFASAAKLVSVPVGVEQGLLHDVRRVDLGPTTVAKLKFGQHPQIAAESFRHQGCGIDRLGHNSPPRSLAAIGAVTGRAAIAIFSTSISRRRQLIESEAGRECALSDPYHRSAKRLEQLARFV